MSSSTSSLKLPVGVLAIVVLLVLWALKDASGVVRLTQLAANLDAATPQLRVRFWLSLGETIAVTLASTLGAWGLLSRKRNGLKTAKLMILLRWIITVTDTIGGIYSTTATGAELAHMKVSYTIICLISSAVSAACLFYLARSKAVQIVYGMDTKPSQAASSAT